MQKPARGLRSYSPRVTEGESRELVFRGAIEELMADVLKGVRTKVSDQTALLDNIIAEVRKLKDRGEVKPSSVQAKEMSVLKLQQDMSELKEINDGLCERLFDLNQKLVRAESDSLKVQRERLQHCHERELAAVRRNFEKEKEQLQGKVERYRNQCFNLEDRLALMMKEKEKTNKHYWQLQKYLSVIEELSLEVEKLKQQPSKFSAIDTKICNEEQDCLSNRYSEPTYSKCPTCLRDTTRVDSLGEYYVSEIPQQRSQKGSDYRTDLRSIYVPLPKNRESTRKRVNSPSHQTILISEQLDRMSGIRETRNTSKDRQSTSREKPLVIYRSSYEEGRGRSSSKGFKEDYLRAQEKEGRMRAVESKLSGLKRQLQREVRSMKN